MEVSRRTFIKTTLIGGAGVSVFGFSLAPVYAQTQGLKIARTTETRSTCPYCSVSCGVIIHTLGDKAKNAIPQVVHVEGDPDHPINRGTLCPKGASLEQDIVNWGFGRLAARSYFESGQTISSSHNYSGGDERFTTRLLTVDHD